MTAGPGAALAELLRRSRPRPLATRRIPGLGAAARVEVDRAGVPTVTAACLADAAAVLGYLTARDRFFQMDLLRRRAAGRMSELVGPAALAEDVRQRTLGLARAAPRLTSALPPGHAQLLEAYAAGVNAALDEQTPFEVELLAYVPEPWHPAHSMLVAAYMAQRLASDGTDKRCVDVIRRELPAAAADFLLGSADPHATDVAGRPLDRGLPAVPPELAKLVEFGRRNPPDRVVVGGPDRAIGSNAWAIAAGRTRAGRAILANDMHLYLTVPDVWYRAALSYEGTRVDGLLVPGIPVAVAGSNGRVAWGCTRLTGSTVDLVEIDLDPHRDDRYRAEDGWRELVALEERIDVRGAESEHLLVRETIWGPIAGPPLAGRPLALRWSALEPGGLDLGLVELARADDVESACAAANAAAGPALNVLLADRAGRVAWTVCGRFPARDGHEPEVVRPRFGERSWQRILEPEELPRLVAPDTGVVVSANNIGPQHLRPGAVAFNGFGGVRAARVAERLDRLGDRADEAALFSLQHDVDASFFEFYRGVVLGAVERTQDPDEGLRAAAGAVAAWDGSASVDAVGLPILVAFREAVREALFAGLLARCVAADPDFVYEWHAHEAPLRSLLTERADELTPAPYASFDDLLRASIELACRMVTSLRGDREPSRTTWGDVNPAGIRHPLSEAFGLANLLDRPDEPVPGCAESVRVAWPGFGASMRLVVGPGHDGNAVLTVPGGQAGHPLEPTYADGWDAWLHGTPRPFRPGDPVTAASFEPGDGSATS